MRKMARVIGTMTMATGITAATARSGNRAGAKIPQLGNLPQDCGPLLFQLGERVGHGTSLCRAYHIRSAIGHEKRNSSGFNFHVAHPPRTSQWRRRSKSAKTETLPAVAVEMLWVISGPPE